MFVHKENTFPCLSRIAIYKPDRYGLSLFTSEICQWEQIETICILYTLLNWVWGFLFFLVDERTFWSMKFVIRNCIIPCFRRFQIYLIAPCVNKGTFSNPLDQCHDPNFCQLIKNGKQSSLECLHNSIAIFFLYKKFPLHRKHFE